MNNQFNLGDQVSDGVIIGKVQGVTKARVYVKFSIYPNTLAFYPDELIKVNQERPKEEENKVVNLGTLYKGEFI